MADTAVRRSPPKVALPRARFVRQGIWFAAVVTARWCIQHPARGTVYSCVNPYPYSLDFRFSLFASMKALISSDISSSFNHCSLYKVTGKRPMP